MTAVTAKRFSITEYHRLIKLGFIQEGDNTQLIRGELIQMVAKGTAHTVYTGLMNRALAKLLDGQAALRNQEPIVLANHSEPEPDLVVAQGDLADYLHHHPQPIDILLVIEVSGSTLIYDQTTKLQLYAEYGIQQYWIVNLLKIHLESYSHPHSDISGQFGYLDHKIYLPQQSIAIPGFEDMQLDLKQVFPEMDNR
jgi:Uma2 family endonuclease